MVDDTTVDVKLQQFSHEIRTQAFVPACKVEDAFAMRGVDGTGKAGIFAAILLRPGPTPALNELMAFRAQLAQRLKQLDARVPTWPIIIPGTPEATNGTGTIPGGRAYFEKVKGELASYQQKLKTTAFGVPTFLDEDAVTARRSPRPLRRGGGGVARATKATPRKAKASRRTRHA